MTTSRDDLDKITRGRHIAQIRAVMNLLARGCREEDRQAIEDSRLMLEDSAHQAFSQLKTRQTDSKFNQ